MPVLCHTCALCGKTDCSPDHNCQKVTTDKCSVDECTNSLEYFCETCSKGICETHSYLYKGTIYCNEHYPKCESSGCYNVQSGNICSTCGNAICVICTQTCGLCGEVYCPDHAQPEHHDCPAKDKCSWDGCLEEYRRICVECGKHICDIHSLECSNCTDKIYCPTCFRQHEHTCTYCQATTLNNCNNCKTPICEDHEYRMSDGGIYCPDCYAAQSCELHEC